jgi:hypothetical protein
LFLPLYVFVCAWQLGQMILRFSSELSLARPLMWSSSRGMGPSCHLSFLHTWHLWPCVLMRNSLLVLSEVASPIFLVLIAACFAHGEQNFRPLRTFSSQVAHVRSLFLLGFRVLLSVVPHDCEQYLFLLNLYGMGSWHAAHLFRCKSSYLALA